MWDNPWFVGIGGGIVSGLLVFIITSSIVNKVSRKEYYKKVKEANREIIALLIMSVSEGRIPSLSVIESLLKSLTRSYGVKDGDLNNISETLEDLIKEIFETRFVSNDKKNELSEALINLISEHEKVDSKIEMFNPGYNSTGSYLYALILSVLILSAFVIAIVITDPKITNVPFLDKDYILPFATGVIIAVSFKLASAIRQMKNDKKLFEANIDNTIEKFINR